MGKYDFTHGYDRKGTASFKWDTFKMLGFPEDTLALSMADMEFAVMPEITEAVVKRLVDHPVYGYSLSAEGQDEAVCGWMKRRHGWDAKPE